MSPTGPSPCPLCGASQLDQLLRIGSAEQITRCSGCGVLSMRDAAMHLVTCDYDERYYRRASPTSVGYLDYFGAERAFRTLVAEAMAAVLDLVHPAFRTHLDVGCGGGYLVEAVRSMGRSAQGVDSSAFAVAAAQSLGYTGIRHSSLTAEVASGRRYELVSLMDVIEHIPEPVRFLKDAYRLVAPGGSLVVLTPRVGGRLFDEQGDDYVHFHTDHCFYFDAATLTRAMSIATGGAPRIHDVLDLLTETEGVHDTVLRKYREERDSIVGVVSKP